MSNVGEVCQPIRVVAAKTGLSTHVIRIWEKRYRAVTPGRSGTNRRLYSAPEVQRLNLLRQATAVGHSIGHIAHLSDDQLRRLAAEFPSRVGGPSALANGAYRAAHFVDASLSAASALNSAALQEALDRALVAFGHQGLLRLVIAPLTQQVGDLWRKGLLGAAHEHLLSATIKVHLGGLTRQCTPARHAPCLIVATPVGQIHELGAVLVQASAANLGWRAVYLGASLPAAEIAGAAAQHRAKEIALSIVYPEDDPQLPEEILTLRRLLAPETAIIVGGRAASALQATLQQIGAAHAENLEDLSCWLENRRRGNRRERGAN